MIAGWSDARQAYEAYRVVSYSKPSVDLSNGDVITLEPFTRYPLPAAVWCNVMPETMHEFDLVPPLQNEETSDVLARLVCACRAYSGYIPDDDSPNGEGRFFMAGGFIQMTLLQRDFSQSWIAHRWPEDTIGKPINTAGPDRYPTWLKQRHTQAAVT